MTKDSSRTRISDRDPSAIPVVGWVEFVGFSAWGIRQLRAKMDTGAKTSAIHVENLVECSRSRVRFDVVISKKPKRVVHVEAPISRRGRVRSSNGQYAQRIFVTTQLDFAGAERAIEISLVDRESMIHRVLLGRAALEGVLVDVRGRYRLGKAKSPRRKVKKRKRPKVASKSTRARKPSAGAE